MALIRRIVQSSENLLLFKTNPLLPKNNGIVDFTSRVKKVDLPSPPKRPLTAYMIFCKEKRHDVLRENPSLTSPEQIKMLAEKWSHLTSDMKKPYEISAREETVSYGVAHKKFYENLTEEQKEEMARLKSQKKESRRLLKLKRALKGSDLPKPAVSAYALFVQSQAKAGGEIKRASDFIKRAADKWNSLSDGEKKIFEAKAVADKARFVNEMEQWKKRMIAEGNSTIVEHYNELKGKGKGDQDDALQQALLRAKKDSESGGKRKPKQTDISKN